MAVALVQQVAGAVATATNTLVMTSVPTVGNLLIACVTTSRTSVAGPLQSIVQTGVTWGPGLSNNLMSVIPSIRVYIWFARVTAAGTSTTVVMSIPVGGQQSANVSEWSGLSTAARPQDGGGGSNTGANPGSAAPAPTGPYGTSAAGGLIIACIGYGSPTAPTSFPAGYTQLAAASVASTPGTFPAYLTPASLGPQSASWVPPGFTTPWSTNILGFFALGVTPPSGGGGSRGLPLLGVGRT